MEIKISDLILYKNNQLIALAKPATIPVQPDKSEAKSLLDLAEIYAKTKLHIVNRLDRPASGVVIFAKNSKAVTKVNAQFQERTVTKSYLVVVGNLPKEPKATLTHFLKRNGKIKKAEVVKSVKEGGKKAVLDYEVLDSIERYHLLKINLHTGRFHQIRAQLGAIGSPIKGDTKYGFKRGNKDRSIHLHAWQLSIKHPVNGDLINLEAPIPDEVVWNAFDTTKIK